MNTFYFKDEWCQIQKVEADITVKDFTIIYRQQLDQYQDKDDWSNFYKELADKIKWKITFIEVFII